MRFVYSYRTSANELKRAEVTAPSREAAFAALKAQGIKPARVDLAPGFGNWLASLGKRWYAIAVLCALCLVLCATFMATKKEVKTLKTEVKNIQTEQADAALYADRAQIYGDPGVLREAEACGWSNVFTNKLDQILAAYAIPAKVTTLPEVDLSALSTKHQAQSTPVPSALCLVPCAIQSTDLAEYQQMKRIVNGMKREARAYLAAGGTITAYLDRLAERQRSEVELLSRITKELESIDDPEIWRTKNAALRNMGLPMVERQE